MRRRIATVVLLGSLALVGPYAARAVAAPAGSAPGAAPRDANGSDLAAQTELANRYAPVVRLVDSSGPCVQGEPYQPESVNTVLDNPDVALRGPWSGSNLVSVAPTAQDLSSGLAMYNLDFPGNALSPGCSYADWAAQIAETSPPTVYAHVVTQSGFPDRLVLQYWFFYLYNDFNDKHEGDWEMIQLDFHATDASQALTVSPYETGYSQHEGAERAEWGSGSKLVIVDGTHPVVYPAYGSHANYYSSHLYLGNSGEQGVGCDNTVGPSRTVNPTVVVFPQQRSTYLADFPWLGFDGRWGERHSGFNNGPTGPNTKQRWSQPFTWVEQSWRDKSFVVPEGGLFGYQATSFFCAAVAHALVLARAVRDDRRRGRRPGRCARACA